MAFSDAFIRCMNEAGVAIKTEVPAGQEDYFKQSVDYLDDWFKQFDNVPDVVNPFPTGE